MTRERKMFRTSFATISVESEYDGEETLKRLGYTFNRKMFLWLGQSWYHYPEDTDDTGPTEAELYRQNGEWFIAFYDMEG